MDEYLESINVATRLLAAADGLEPSEPSHLVMNEYARAAGTCSPRPAWGPTLSTRPCTTRSTSTVSRSWSRSMTPGDRRGPGCPVCGGRTIPIIYGMPVPTLGDLADLGVVEPAGCIIDADDPARRCVRCGAPSTPRA